MLTKFKRKRAVAICKQCKHRLKDPSCVYTDIEAAKTDEIDQPKCIAVTEYQNCKTKSIRQTTIGGGVDYLIESQKPPTADTTGGIIRPPPRELLDHYSISGKRGKPFKWDETYTKIAAGIKNGLGRNALAEKTGLSPTAISSRLATLEKMGAITKRTEKAQTISGGSKNIYILTRGWSNCLGSTEEAPPRFDFDGAHNWAFQFKILKGEPPKSDKKVKMNNWEYYIFAAENLDWTIQVNHTSEPSFIVFPGVDLGSGTVAELQQKYSNYSYKIAQFFQHRHRIEEISLPLVCREQHFERRNDPIAKALKAIYGDLRTPNIRADNTPKKDTLEIVGAEAAHAVEWTVIEMPRFAAYAQQEFKEIKSAILRIEDQLEHIPKEKIHSFIVKKPEPQEPQPTFIMKEEPQQQAPQQKSRDPMFG